MKKGAGGTPAVQEKNADSSSDPRRIVVGPDGIGSGIGTPLESTGLPKSEMQRAQMTNSHDHSDGKAGVNVRAEVPTPEE
jgi:hypothetical protein